MKKLPAERVELLNTGHVESRNLMEFLVLDPELILKNNFPDFNYIKPAGSIGIVQKLEYIYAKRNVSIVKYKVVLRGASLICCPLLSKDDSFIWKALGFGDPSFCPLASFSCRVPSLHEHYLTSSVL